MKPTSNFKLSGTAKRLLATFVNAHERGHYKRMLIDGQLASEVKAPLKDKKD